MDKGSSNKGKGTGSGSKNDNVEPIRPQKNLKHPITEQVGQWFRTMPEGQLAVTINLRLRNKPPVCFIVHDVKGYTMPKDNAEIAIYHRECTITIKGRNLNHGYQRICDNIVKEIVEGDSRHDRSAEADCFIDSITFDPPQDLFPNGKEKQGE